MYLSSFEELILHVGYVGPIRTLGLWGFEYSDDGVENEMNVIEHSMVYSYGIEDLARAARVQESNFCTFVPGPRNYHHSRVFTIPITVAHFYR